VAQDAIVALPMHNSFEQTAFFIGAWRLGATPLALSPHFPEAELEKILQVAETEIVIKEGQDLSGEPLWSGPYRIAARFKAQTSGGSTGLPKVLMDTAPSTIDIAGNTWRWGWSEGPALFVPGPTYHSGPMNHMTEGLARGLHFVTMRRFDAAKAAELITRHRPHWALFVPTMMNRILKLPPDVLARTDFSTLKYVWHSAASCPSWLKQEWIDLVGPEAVWEIFGGSEGVSTTIINGTEWLEHKGSVGRCSNGEIAIFDEDGNPVPSGTVGEIYMRNKLVDRRFKVTTATRRRMIDDWESFGDLGWLDEDGYLFLADRRVDMINAGGQNVYPAEVEAAIQSYPGVGDAVVFGRPDDDLGEIVCALVYAPHREIGKQALLDHLATQIVRYKIPRKLSFTDAPIRNDAGKVRRSELTIAE
jgi:bile acid-coenzyme A ligase